MALIDYGAGNLTSVIRGLEAVGARVDVVTAADGLRNADGVVVPGVGHFAQTERLDGAWRRRLRAMAADGVPVLGICLGMQWLFDGSDEAPGVPGLGLLRGRAVRIDGAVKVPHLGWNQVTPVGTPSVLLGSRPGTVYGYFAHSFAVAPGADAVGVTTHGVTFAAVVESGSVFGIQCHPEKSSRAGLAMLANFMAVVEARRPETGAC